VKSSSIRYWLKIIGLFALAIALFSEYSSAQGVSVRATVEPPQIMIGQQALIDLQVIAPKDKNIQFPVYEKEIVPGVEVVAMLKPDTVIENNVMTINFKYVVTSFDSTLYHIPAIPVFDGKDTILSNSVGIKVVSPALKDSTLAYLEKLKSGETDSIDFNQLGLNDIKPIQKPPFVWTDYLGILWIVLGILLLLALIAAIIYFILHKKKKGYFFTPTPVLPAHVRALQELDKLKADKIWQHGREKEFYTRLTDILRQYLYERYGMKAREMTSGEILNEMRKYTEAESVYENLKQVLSTADLVKFAKYKPYPDENDLSMMNAYFVVNQTREPDPLPDKKENEDDESKRKEQL
jgi:hypothetical protein